MVKHAKTHEALKNIKKLIRVGRGCRSVGGKGAASLQYVFPSKGGDLHKSHAFSGEDTPVSLLPDVPENVKQVATSPLLDLLGLSGDHVIPPLRDRREARPLRLSVDAIPRVYQVSHSGGEGAVFAEMDRSFRRAQAKLTAGVVGPSPDSEHVSRQEFPVDGQPSKKLTLWVFFFFEIFRASWVLACFTT